MSEVERQSSYEGVIARRIISHSEVEALGQCETKHYYGHELKITSKSHSVGLQRGTDGHVFFETFFKSILAGNSNTHAKTEAIMATAGLQYGPEIINKCSVWVDKIWPTLGWKIVAVELELRVAISETLVYACKIDLLVEINGVLVLVDHKFLYDFYTQQLVDIFPQMPKYMAALRQHGYDVKYAIYNMVRTREVTDFDKKYQQLETHPNDFRIKNAFREQVQVMKRIDEGIVNPTHTANKMNCANCQFADLCAEDLAGKSTKLMIEAFYVPNTYGYEDI
jgi:hypothetical protein